VLDATLTDADSSVSAGGTTQINGTLSNTGTGIASMSQVGFYVPTGWSFVAPIKVNNQTLSCTSLSNHIITCGVGFSINPGASVPVQFGVQVPNAAAQGLYSVNMDAWFGETGYGGDSENYFENGATVSVGAVRTAKPSLTCSNA